MRLVTESSCRKWAGRFLSDIGFCAEQFLDALYRIALLIEETVDAPGQGYVLGAIITTVARSLQRPQLREFALPIAQDVLRDSKFGGELADRSKGVRGLFAGRHPKPTWRSRRA